MIHVNSKHVRRDVHKSFRNCNLPNSENQYTILYKYYTLLYDNIRFVLSLLLKIPSLAAWRPGGLAQVMSDDLRAMRRVLRRLEFIDKDGVVQLKGRMACEITSADEILMTETLGMAVAVASWHRNIYRNMQKYAEMKHVQMQI